MASALASNGCGRLHFDSGGTVSTVKHEHLRLPDIVYIGDLFKRWPGAALYRFRALIRKALLTPYRYEVTDVDGDGKIEHICFADVDMQEFLSGKGRLPDCKVVFNLEEVERLEGQYPQLKLGKTKKGKWGTAGILTDDTDHVLEQWRQALANADIKPLWRVRLEIMLKRKAGEKVAVLEVEYSRSNIPRDVRNAKKHDVPILKKQFPNLPDLG